MNRGVLFAFVAALLFGLSTPVAKFLLGHVESSLLAGLLYAGSGLGLGVVFVARALLGREAPAPVPAGRARWLLAAIVVGGVLAPVFLMRGLAGTSASTAALLLNLEGVFTASVAWGLGRENADRRIVLGMVAIVAAGVVLSWQTGAGIALSWPALFVVAACFCWGVDNNLTQAVSSADPVLVAGLKGLVAGAVNVALAVVAGGATWPAASTIALALVTGFVGYGLSLVCFVVALRHLGAARTGAYFALAPFLGAGASVAFLGDPLGLQLVVGALLMGIGVAIHLTEHHEHEHTHEPLTHAHEHTHGADDHHVHDHGADVPEAHLHGASLAHEHTHTPLTHTHPHAPDIHHRHTH
jgi:drug/metabolite transporter (DMT)-like permease